MSEMVKVTCSVERLGFATWRGVYREDYAPSRDGVYANLRTGEPFWTPWGAMRWAKAIKAERKEQGWA